jgi:hypothetical protein
VNERTEIDLSSNPGTATRSTVPSPERVIPLCLSAHPSLRSPQRRAMSESGCYAPAPDPPRPPVPDRPQPIRDLVPPLRLQMTASAPYKSSPLRLYHRLDATEPVSIPSATTAVPATSLLERRGSPLDRVKADPRLCLFLMGELE